MTEFEIQHLLRRKRYSDVGLTSFYLILYTPLGLILLIFRLVLGLAIWILGTALPDISFTRSLLSKLFCLFFGIIINVKKSYNKKDVKVLISNQMSPLDPFVVHTATKCVMPCTTTLYSPLSYAIGLHNVGTVANTDEMKKCIATVILNNTSPVLLQPEGKITNGRSLLKFKDWPFSFTNEVQPVYLKIHRPILDIAITTIESTFVGDMFWYLFSPITIYELCFLPVSEKGELSDLEFADTVRQQIAHGLKVELCSHSASDLIEWEKRTIFEQSRLRAVASSASSLAGQNNPEIHRMARQVKEVLPMVPYNVILRDLMRTKNVDVTITNILEGHVTYTPESVPSSSTSSLVLSTPGVSVTKEITGKDFNTAATTFPKSAQERMQAFQDRKLQLIMNARKKYIDKHGLNALASNDC